MDSPRHGTSIELIRASRGLEDHRRHHLDLRESLGGPILIAQVSGETFRAGLLPFVSMIAFVSINLFLINLLPIPVLDGGHILLFGIEAVTRQTGGRKTQGNRPGRSGCSC